MWSRLLALAAIILIPSVAAAQPVPMADPMLNASSKTSEKAVAITCPTDQATTRFVTTATTAFGGNEANLQVFPWGSMVRVSCPENTRFCWGMDPDLQMTTSFWVTDNGSQTTWDLGTDGPGACFDVRAGGAAEQDIKRIVFKPANRPGRRAGFCTGGTGTDRYPCDVDGDCGTNGTCRHNCSTLPTGMWGMCSSPFEFTLGPYLFCRAVSAASACAVEILK